METILSFGVWIKRRRKALDLTQDALANLIGCSTETIRKIEGDARRPSRQIAARLAEHLALPPEERDDFMRCARAELAVDQLPPPVQSAPRSAFVPAPFAPPYSDAPRANLPAQPNTLIGREREIAAVVTLLHSDGVRLLTLTGPGGTGKTRLAIQAAAELLDTFADGVWFVNLAPILAPTLVAATIARALGLVEAAGTPIDERLRAFLRTKQLLLLLDNFEHVIDAAPLVAALLAAGPGLKVLVTSRATLHLYGEHEFAVPPLALPPAFIATESTESTEIGRTRGNNARILAVSSVFSVAELTQYEAVRLFIARARAAKADFVSTPENAAAVAEICRRLDGLPLAIELAAARVKLFAPEALLDRLSSPLALLTGGPRDRPTRQQTIRNTIDWSYNLLSENEQALFRRLGVFVGGCTLEAIETVASKLSIENEQLKNGLDNDTFSILHLVEVLVDQSLIKQEEGTAGEPRFVMLETIRAYALECQEERGEGDAVRRRHIEFFLALAELAEPQLRGGPAQLMWYRRLEAEQDNLRAALAWSLSAQGDVELGLRLAGASGRFWDLRTSKSELRAWIEGLLAPHAGALPLPSASARAKALGWLAAATEEDYGHATTLVEEQLSLWREIGDRDGMADALVSLGSMARDQGDYRRAQALAEEGLALFMEQETAWGIGWAFQILGDVALDQGAIARATSLFQNALDVSRQADMQESIAWSLINLGRIAYVQGDIVRALPLFEETLALFRDLGERNGMAQVLLDLAHVARVQGAYDQAGDRFAESLVLCQKVQNVRDTGYCLAGLAGIAAVSSQPERAARLFGAAEALRDSLGVPLPPVNRADYDRDVAAAHAQLDDDTFATAWAAGRSLTLDEAIAEALEEWPIANESALDATATSL